MMSRAGCAVALPWLAQGLEALRGDPDAPQFRAPAMQWLLGRSQLLGPVDLDWRGWLLNHDGTSDLLRRHAAGPCRLAAAMQASSAPDATTLHGATTWACAEPVHLAIGVDHVRLAPALNPPLDPEECAELLPGLNDALEHQGARLIAVDGRRWLLACRDEIQCETQEPVAVQGRDIHDYLPQGRDGRAVRRLMNELQMLLHEHPVGTRRAACGLPPANAIWPWGFGPVRAVMPRELAPLASDDDWLDDLWRMHDGMRRATPAEVLQGSRDRARPVLVASVDSANSAATPTARLGSCEQSLFAPLRRAIDSGSVASVDLLCGQNSRHFGRASRFAFWRRPISLHGPS